MQPPKRRKRPQPLPEAKVEHAGCLSLIGDLGGYIAFVLLIELLAPYLLNRFFGIGLTAGTFIAIASLFGILGLLYLLAGDRRD